MRLCNHVVSRELTADAATVRDRVRQTAALVRHAVEQKQKVLVVAGPVVVHTGGAAP